MSSHEEASLRLHEKHKGKIEVRSKVPLNDHLDLSAAYTPGVAEPCRRIADDPELAYRYTIKSNTVAIVSDGSAVLGLGDIGPLAALPVMEGKALLFKAFADIDAFPLCLDTAYSEESTWRTSGLRAASRSSVAYARSSISPFSTTTSMGPPSSCWQRWRMPAR